MTTFRFPAPDTQGAVPLIRAGTDMVEISGQLRVDADDPDDDKFLETARTGRANLIVSGDLPLLARGLAAGVSISATWEFLDRLGGGSA